MRETRSSGSEGGGIGRQILPVPIKITYGLSLTISFWHPNCVGWYSAWRDSAFVNLADENLDRWAVGDHAQQ